jgi:methylenetetrahydrofolate dehydrogenase (NADP+)/methenyltetrahydrofolate cyclohydrolase
VSASLIDGKAIAAAFRKQIATQTAELRSAHGIIPGLAAVLVGDDPASAVYVRSKRRDCEKVGMASTLHHLDAGVAEADLLDLIDSLNRDAAIHGILVQLPLPGHLNARRVLDSVDPLKDVDGLHPENLGLLAQGRPRYCPCTPLGVVELLKCSNVAIGGADIVVLGRSDLVGKPLALLLMQKAEHANATVTVCHSRTRNIAEHTRRADVVVAAMGQPRFLKADMVRPGAVVIDVGTTRVDDALAGDVDFDAVREVAGKITPVPGGVGPMTRALLLHNTLLAARPRGQ